MANYKQIHIGLACNKRSWTYCINHGIAFTVYFPLGSDKSPLLKNPIALKLADKHKVQPTNILKGFKLSVWGYAYFGLLGRFYGSDIVELAFLSMLKLVVLNGDATDHFILTFGARSHQNIVHISSGIFGMWIE